MEMFATQNRNHMGATAGQNFNALGGKFWNVSQLILLTGQKLYKGMRHPLYFQPSSLQYLHWLGMTFQMEPLTISITNISNIIFIHSNFSNHLTCSVSPPGLAPGGETEHVPSDLNTCPLPHFLADCFLSFDAAQVSLPLESLAGPSLEEVRCSCQVVSQL